MKITLDCISCMLRKAFQTCEMIGLEPEKKELISRRILKMLSEVSFEQTTGHINREVHRLIRDMSGVADPFANSKSYYTDLALRAYPELKQTVQDAGDRFDAAVRVALAGAAINYVFDGKADIVTIFNGIEDVLNRELGCNHISQLKERAASANRILYLADNAGETVFDRILIEELPRDRVTYAVKGGPILNDATMMDARFAGVTDLVEVIDNGSDAPGTILEYCSADFQKRFHAADLVIAKGQANYKTLKRQQREIFFIFRVKCAEVAANLHCGKGTLVVKSSRLDVNGRAAAPGDGRIGASSVTRA